MVTENQKIDEKMSYEEFCGLVQEGIPVYVEGNIMPAKVQIYRAGYRADIHSQLGQALMYQANNGNIGNAVLEQDCLAINQIKEGVVFVILVRSLYAIYIHSGMGMRGVWNAISNAIETLDSAVCEADDAEEFS